ncbi:ABC transporter permease [Chitinophaga sp.]|uniref:ABC transporter permease n=1 Tax=Chitinophaga sp. TaxID=1869181 RepID=UPI0031D0C7C9
MLKYYFRTAWRNLMRSKAYAAVNITGLTLGIVACLAIFMITRFEMGFDTFHPAKERIYRVVGSQQVAGNLYHHGYVPGPMVAGAYQPLTGIEKAAGFYNYYAKVTVPRSDGDALQFDSPAREAASPVIIAQPGYFEIFQYEWLAGNPRTALQAPFSVVLTDKEARRYFGSEAPRQLTGRQLIYNDSLRVTVTGIVKAWQGHTDLAFSNFISFATIAGSFLKEETDLHNWRNWNSYAQLFVKLAPNVRPEQVASQFPALVKEHFGPGEEHNVNLQLQPLHNLHFNSVYEDAYIRKAHQPTLRILMAVALFILVIAAINYANLTAAQAVKKERSAGIRKIMGSSRTGLALQFFCETALVVLAAIVLSALLVSPVLRLFDAFLPAGIHLRLFSVSTWAFFAGALLFTVLLAGAYPAYILSSPRAVQALAGGRAQRQQFRGILGKSLIAAQFTISLVFVTALLIVEKQVHYMMHKDLGFKEEGIVTVPLPAGSAAAGRLFAEKTRQLPGVEAVSLHRGAPLSARHGNTSIKKAAGGEDVMSAFEFCDENMLPLYGIQLAAGRNLLPGDTIREFLINETCAKRLGFAIPADAVGQLVQVGIGGKTGPVAGVVRDFHTASLHQPIAPFFMTSNANAARTVGIRLHHSALSDVQRAWDQVFPGQKFSFAFLDETIAGYYDTEQRTKQLIRFAMLTAIIISCIGLFGMAALTAGHRTKEIGIRKVLGASVGSIAARFMLEFLKPVMAAIMLGLPLAWLGARQWLQHFPFRVSLGPSIWLAAALAGIGIAMLTLCFQTMRTATANPVKALQSES